MHRSTSQSICFSASRASFRLRNCSFRKSTSGSLMNETPNIALAKALATEGPIWSLINVFSLNAQLPDQISRQAATIEKRTKAGIEQQSAMFCCSRSPVPNISGATTAFGSCRSRQDRRYAARFDAVGVAKAQQEGLGSIGASGDGCVRVGTALKIATCFGIAADTLFHPLIDTAFRVPSIVSALARRQAG